MSAVARDFVGTAQAALTAVEAVLSRWLPGGEYRGQEYLPLNPTRADSKQGSFSINCETGKWSDFATGDKGGDFVSLIAYLDGCSQIEAKRRLDDFLGSHEKQRVTSVTRVTKKVNGKKNKALNDRESVTQPEYITRDARDTQSIPDSAPVPTFHHSKHGEPSTVWTYRDEQGRALFHLCRFDTADGKRILPRTWNGKRWQWKGAPAPRPLYNLHHLAQKPYSLIIITEGEKAADAAATQFTDCVTTTTPNGAQAPNKCELSPLKDRDVRIWPDNDKQGAAYAENLAALALEAGAASVSILNLDKLPCELPQKGDAADVDLTPDEAAALVVNGDAWRKVSKPNAAPDRPVRFTVSNKGVHYHGTNTDGDPLSPQWVCSRLDVIAQTRDADGNAWGRLLEWRDNDGKAHRWAMPVQLLAGDGNEYRRELLSQGLEIAPNTKARQLLTEFIQTAPVKTRARCVSKTGWHGGVFVLPDTTIGDNSEQVIFQSLHEPAAVRIAGTIEPWRDSIGRYCIGNSRLTLAVSAAFAAPLLEIAGDESGGLNFQGKSSSGKTTALHAAVSVYSDPSYLQRWRATTNGLEATALAYNDGLLCLDELAQVEAKEAGSVAYMLANGCGKQRARSDGLAKQKATWRILFLSAGEIGLAQHMREAGRKTHAGQEVRLADIPADAGSGYGIFENLHGYNGGGILSDAIKEATCTYYGAPIRKYLTELVALNGDKLRERLHKLRADFTSEALPDKADGQVRRVCGRFALIAAGGELATGLNITGWPPSAAIEAAKTCFDAWLENRGGEGAQEEKNALAQVQAFFEAHGDSRFTLLDGNEKSDDRQRTIDRAGFKRVTSDGSAEYFVLPEAWRADLCAGIDPTFTAQLCIKHGLIKPDSEGRAVSTRRLADMGRRRCYHFTCTSIDEADNES